MTDLQHIAGDHGTTISPVVVVRGVAKNFGATRALDSADLEVRTSEVHTVMGENGSGKSSLVKILSGVHRPDRGSVQISGEAANQWRSPAAAREHGVATVFQEVLTVPGRSILENVWLGARKTSLSSAGRRRRAEEVMQQLLGSSIDLDSPVDALSLSERQACCIARALVVKPRLLILDESTSALDIATRDRLFEIIRELTASGVSVIFISHRMDEIYEISDVVTVLRSGTTVADRLDLSRTTVGDLVSRMSAASEDAQDQHVRQPGAVVVRAAGVILREGAQPIDLQFRSGELVGLAGLEGHGQDAFIRALRGQGAAGGLVERVGANDPVALDGPRAARKLGIAYVPRERRNEALFEQLSIRENFGLPTMGEDTTAGMLSARRTTRRLFAHGRPLRLKVRRSSDSIATLSGGNQQKVVIARALADRPQVLLLNDPTRGIDVTAKQDLYKVLRAECAKGTTVVLLSTEVDELVDLVDRVLVFRDHELVGEIPRVQLSRQAVVSAYFGPTGHGELTGTKGI